MRLKANLDPCSRRSEIARVDSSLYILTHQEFLASTLFSGDSVENAFGEGVKDSRD